MGLTQIALGRAGKLANTLTLALLSVIGCVSIQPVFGAERGVDAARIVAPPAGEWLSTGRTYDEQRFSPLDKINASNVKQLGLAWFADLDTARGQEATPLMIDGKLYVSTAWSKVKAYDGRTGELLWSYDPRVPRATAAKACCDAINRGLAAWRDKLFVGTLDGRLIALDRYTGAERWSVVTVDQGKAYTITGAPRVIDGKVIIGNGGAEFGVRGFVTAYDAETGKQVWRFYTVPAAPGSATNEPAYLRRAASTWYGRWWELGGGGSVWDAMAYDPILGLLYIGVGNGTPWSQSYRSDGKGDNLYLSSIVAINASTGAYAWHYQVTPGDEWDFDATQHLILADFKVDGTSRHVLMQASKNGFFYVIDRANGHLLSADNFVPVNWARGVDMTTGRPVVRPEASYHQTGKPFFGSPGAIGAHSWQPMAFDPKKGLVFIPANITGFPYFPSPDWKPEKLGINVGIDMSAGAMPAIPAVRQNAAEATKGALIAWDPVAKRERWRVSFRGPSNGGVLATRGDLVFEGDASGQFVAYSATDGSKLWSFPSQTGIVAAPISYEINGEQYVAVLAGWGGIWALAAGALADVSGPTRNISRMLVFKLGAKESLPPPPLSNSAPFDPPPSKASEQIIAAGAEHYGRYCGGCHGDAAVSGGLIPDLRRSSAIERADSFKTIVYDGELKNNGMVGFRPVMTSEEIETIRQYVIHRANEDKILELEGAPRH